LHSFEPSFVGEIPRSSASLRSNLADFVWLLKYYLPCGTAVMDGISYALNHVLGHTKTRAKQFQGEDWKEARRRSSAHVYRWVLIENVPVLEYSPQCDRSISFENLGQLFLHQLSQSLCKSPRILARWPIVLYYKCAG
jgi:hypothetical protein